MFAELLCALMFAASRLSCTDLSLLVPYFRCSAAQGMMNSEDYRKRKPQLKQEVSR